MKFGIAISLCSLFLLSCKPRTSTPITVEDDPESTESTSIKLNEVQELYISHLQERKHEALLTLLLKHKDTFDDDPQYLNMLGVAYMTNRQHETAERYFQELCKKNASGQAKFNLAESKFVQEKFREASTIFLDIYQDPKSTAVMRDVSFYKYYITLLCEGSPEEISAIRLSEANISDLAMAYCFVVQGLLTDTQFLDEAKTTRKKLQLKPGHEAYEDTLNELELLGKLHPARPMTPDH